MKQFFTVTYIQQLIDFLNSQQYGKMALIVGRYYAMDRDKRWERMQIAYEAMVAGKGDKIGQDKVIDVGFLMNAYVTLFCFT